MENLSNIQTTSGQKKSILKKTDHYSTCSNLKDNNDDTSHLLYETFESPQDCSAILKNSINCNNQLKLSDSNLVCTNLLERSPTISLNSTSINRNIDMDSLKISQVGSLEKKLNMSLKPIASQLKGQQLSNFVTVRCANIHCCYYNQNTICSPRCGSCGQQIELISQMRPRSVSLLSDNSATMAFTTA